MLSLRVLKNTMHSILVIVELFVLYQYASKDLIVPLLPRCMLS
jgi:hypothetical protein